jgi:hypothetical protein
MPASITVVVRCDPRKTHRAAEAVRIALGLATGPNPVTIVLLENAPLLLSEEHEDLVDAEVLEKHLPVLRELGVCLVVPSGTRDQVSLNSDWEIREASMDDIRQVIAESDRVLAF